MAGSSKRQRFTATIYKVGINRCVDVPERVTAVLGAGRAVPVLARVKQRSVRTNLVPRGGGLHRLFLDTEMRRAAGADAGDRVTVELELDERSRKAKLPPDVARALRSTKGGRAAFAELTQNQQREFLSYIEQAKKKETRERRIDQGVELILGMSARKRRKRSRP
jgi:hypothetical protein